jgi:hypothetical protein
VDELVENKVRNLIPKLRMVEWLGLDQHEFHETGDWVLLQDLSHFFPRLEEITLKDYNVKHILTFKIQV